MLPLVASQDELSYRTRKAVEASRKSEFVKWAAKSILTGWTAALPTSLLSARGGSMLTPCQPQASASAAGRSRTLANE